MNFYVTLVFLGIILVSFSLVWVILDKKKVFGIAKDFEGKKQELVEIINDAEQMIEELNRFSDYIVTQMDLKNEELRMNLKNAGEDIKSLVQKAESVRISIASSYMQEERKVEYKAAAVVNGTTTELPAPIQRKTEKVIHINNRYSEVLRLAETGLSELEIAKSLNMGKGEVGLILGIHEPICPRQIALNEKPSPRLDFS